ncbi:hypothetical protein SPBR_06114 [Sporothrix brasiliensis 5110]|uniref:Uncharacterized protein n=1 Tax=Sporothrix brasiliensis 5110 TaxID=1398154 RepID=A0A0C2JAP3_9PEZI|nr:uncharacterized protein SPBR_06114 [Sporothrix brasiliensis 5110]KIH93962.1 hypothetical protein SPBR_06114 [Sporothrix brasiliensis 5110]
MFSWISSTLISLVLLRKQSPWHDIGENISEDVKMHITLIPSSLSHAPYHIVSYRIVITRRHGSPSRSALVASGFVFRAVDAASFFESQGETTMWVTGLGFLASFPHHVPKGLVLPITGSHALLIALAPKGLTKTGKQGE